MLDRVSEEGIAAGYPLAREYPEHPDGLLIAITERRSRAEIDRLADALERAIEAAHGAKPSDPDHKAPEAAPVGAEVTR